MPPEPIPHQAFEEPERRITSRIGPKLVRMIRNVLSFLSMSNGIFSVRSSLRMYRPRRRRRSPLRRDAGPLCRRRRSCRDRDPCPPCVGGHPCRDLDGVGLIRAAGPVVLELVDRRLLGPLPAASRPDEGDDGGRAGTSAAAGRGHRAPDRSADRLSAGWSPSVVAGLDADGRLGVFVSPVAREVGAGIRFGITVASQDDQIGRQLLYDRRAEIGFLAGLVNRVRPSRVGSPPAPGREVDPLEIDSTLNIIGP